MRLVDFTILVFASTTLFAGQKPTTTEFEVATIKRTSADSSPIAMRGLRPLPSGYWRAVGQNLVQLIRGAHPKYKFDGLIVGGPEWARRLRFDVNAKMDPKSSPAQIALMMAHLLEERFELRVHEERRLLPVYILRTSRRDGRLGPQLQHSAVACIQAKEAKQPLTPECRGTTGANLGLNLPVSTVDDFLELLAFLKLDRPVIDRTQLAGYFDFRLSFGCAPFQGALGPAPCNPGAESFFSALEEQAGLKLEPVQEMVDVLVVDSATEPKPD